MDTNYSSVNECILIIDDHSSIRTSLQSFLEDYGYRIFTAENGKAGVEIALKEKPDLIILDIKMPVMSGTKVLEILRNESPDIPIIVVSGTGLIQDCIIALQNGAQDFIIKPIINMSLFLHQIKKVLSNSRIKKENKQYQRNLENTLRQIQADEEMGKRIQMKLLPEKNLTIQDFSLTYHFMPSMCLSGDFVDYMVIDNKYIVLYSADVSGHGVSSALITVLLKVFMKMHFNNFVNLKIDTIIRPDELLFQLNKHLISENLDKHITMFYSVLDIENSVLNFSYAGQFPFPFLWQEGRCEVVACKGYPIGLFHDAKYTLYSKKLKERFRISIFSDGVIELLEHQTNHEKIEFLKTLDTDSGLINFVNELSKRSPFPDDITILSISRG